MRATTAIGILAIGLVLGCDDDGAAIISQVDVALTGCDDDLGYVDDEIERRITFVVRAQDEDIALSEVGLAQVGKAGGFIQLAAPVIVPAGESAEVRCADRVWSPGGGTFGNRDDTARVVFGLSIGAQRLVGHKDAPLVSYARKLGGCGTPTAAAGCAIVGE